MNAIAKRNAVSVPVPVLRLTCFNELVQFAQMAAKSALVPTEYRGRPESIMLAVQLGSELGLSPMQSIQNIAVIGSRPTVWGDAMLALVLAHPDCLDVIENLENGTAVCTVKRRGRAPVVRSFSVDDAKVAKLWGKRGSNGQDTPWVTYPERMLQMRARGFALRDAFPDVLKGLITAEEARDIPTHNGPSFDAVAEPMPAAPTSLTVVRTVGAEPVQAMAASIAPAPIVRGDEWPDDDAIPFPDLDDFDAPPPAAPAEPAPLSPRDAINAAVPILPKRQTCAEWLETLATKLDHCAGRAEVEGALICDEVLRARRMLKGAAKQQLDRITQAAIARTAEQH